MRRKDPKERKFTLTASVKGNIIERIVQEARRRGVTVSDVVNEALGQVFETTNPGNERLRREG